MQNRHENSLKSTFGRGLGGFGSLEGYLWNALGRLGRIWVRLGGVLGVSRPCWCHFGSVRRASWQQMGEGGGASFAIMGRVGSSLGESEVGFLYQDGARVPVNNLPLYESNIFKRLSE